MPLILSVIQFFKNCITGSFWIVLLAYYFYFIYFNSIIPPNTIGNTIFKVVLLGLK